MVRGESEAERTMVRRSDPEASKMRSSASSRIPETDKIRPECERQGGTRIGLPETSEVDPTTTAGEPGPSPPIAFAARTVTTSPFDSPETS